MIHPLALPPVLGKDSYRFVYLRTASLFFISVLLAGNLLAQVPKILLMPGGWSRRNKWRWNPILRIRMPLL